MKPRILDGSSQRTYECYYKQVWGRGSWICSAPTCSQDHKHNLYQEKSLSLPRPGTRALSQGLQGDFKQAAHLQPCAGPVAPPEPWQLPQPPVLHPSAAGCAPTFMPGHRRTFQCLHNRLHGLHPAKDCAPLTETTVRKEKGKKVEKMKGKKK